MGMGTKGTKEVKASDQKQYVPIHVHTNQNVNGPASAEGLLIAPQKNVFVSKHHLPLVSNAFCEDYSCWQFASFDEAVLEGSGFALEIQTKIQTNIKI